MVNHRYHKTLINILNGKLLEWHQLKTLSVTQKFRMKVPWNFFR